MNTIYRIYMYFFAACTLLTVTAKKRGWGTRKPLLLPMCLAWVSIQMELPLTTWLLHLS